MTTTTDPTDSLERELREALPKCICGSCGAHNPIGDANGRSVCCGAWRASLYSVVPAIATFIRERENGMREAKAAPIVVELGSETLQTLREIIRELWRELHS